MSPKSPELVATRWVPVLPRQAQHKAAGTITDIREQRLAKERANDRCAQLDAVFSLSPDGIVTFDPQGYVRYCNPVFRRMTQWSDSDPLGLDEAAFVAALKLRCTRGHQLDKLASLEPAAHADMLPGKPALIAIGSNPSRFIELRLRRSSSASVYKILYLRDVTEQTNLDAMRADYLATAAHELQTTVAGIRECCDLMRNREMDAQQVRECVGLIHESSVRMAHILSDLRVLTDRSNPDPCQGALA